MSILKTFLLTVALLTEFFSLGATNVVANANDTGAGSLRQTIADSFPGDTITFSNTLSGFTILLASGQITLSNAVVIDATSLPGGIQINGNSNGRIFEVASSATVVLNSLTITNGKVTGLHPSGSGGGILNNGKLTLNRCTLVGNQADAYGGGIENNLGGLLTVNQSTLTANSCAAAGGAAIDISGGTVTVSQSTVTGNSALYHNGSGGIYSASAFKLSNSIVAGNFAQNYTNTFGIVSSTGVNLTNGSPLLAPFGNYGGPTQTRPPLPGSPAIDGCAKGTGFATDQRGFVRVSGAFADIGAVEGVFNPAGPGVLTGTSQLGDGSFRLSFTNYGGMPHAVLATPNMALPSNLWSNLGAAVETPPGSGQYQFTDLQAMSYSQRFYQVRSP